MLSKIRSLALYLIPLFFGLSALVSIAWFLSASSCEADDGFYSRYRYHLSDRVEDGTRYGPDVMAIRSVSSQGRNHLYVLDKRRLVVSGDTTIRQRVFKLDFANTPPTQSEELKNTLRYPRFGPYFNDPQDFVVADGSVYVVNKDPIGSSSIIDLYGSQTRTRAYKVNANEFPSGGLEGAFYKYTPDTESEWEPFNPKKIAQRGASIYVYDGGRDNIEPSIFVFKKHPEDYHFYQREANSNLVYKYGNTGDNKLSSYARGLAVDSMNLYALDGSAVKIFKIQSASYGDTLVYLGNMLDRYDDPYMDITQAAGFNIGTCKDISVDNAGNIYLCDDVNVFKVNAGRQVKKIYKASSGTSYTKITVTEDGQFVYVYDANNRDIHQLKRPETTAQPAPPPPAEPKVPKASDASTSKRIVINFAPTNCDTSKNYTGRLSAIGGTGNFVWAIENSKELLALQKNGFRFDGGAGTITRKAGNEKNERLTFTVKVTDRINRKISASRSISINMTSRPRPTLQPKYRR
ncbi:MAG: hypothetical protein ABIH50_05105 [bacterium]